MTVLFVVGSFLLVAAIAGGVAKYTNKKFGWRVFHR